MTSRVSNPDFVVGAVVAVLQRCARPMFVATLAASFGCANQRATESFPPRPDDVGGGGSSSSSLGGAATGVPSAAGSGVGAAGGGDFSGDVHGGEGGAGTGTVTAAGASSILDSGDGDATARTDAEPSEAGMPCPGVFCEDFERGSVDSTKWDLQMAGGSTVAIQSKNVAHGKYAAQFHSLGPPSGGGSSAYVYLISKSAPPVLQVHNFGRAYLYLAPKVSSNNLGLVFGGTTGFPKPTYMSIAGHGAGWQFGFIKLQGSPGGEVQAQPPGPITTLSWFCLEWEFNDQPDTIAVWSDGKAVGTLDPNHVNYPPGHAPGSALFDNKSSGLIGSFAEFGFGFYDWHPGTFAFDVYYDDIVLDSKRVGCL